MKKTVSFRRVETAPSADAWVDAGTDLKADDAPVTPMKRLTIDIPVELHRRVKRECADRGVKMADVVRDLLSKEFSS